MTLLIFVIYFIITLYLYLPSYLPYNTVFFLYFLYKKILFYSQRKKLSVKLNQYDQPNLGNTKYTLIDLTFFLVLLLFQILIHLLNIVEMKYINKSIVWKIIIYSYVYKYVNILINIIL